MVVEACSRLRVFAALESYRYVGFGSTFFSDFLIIHRQLGLTNFISIEVQEGDAERFEFNKPFDYISMRFGLSKDVLPDLPWQDIPSIVWLDYDKALDQEKLGDVAYLAANLEPTSILLVTVRANASDFGTLGQRLPQMQEKLGDGFPQQLEERDLAEARFPAALRLALDSSIQNVIADRNAALPTQNRFVYKQLFNFVYADGAQMVTVGGLLIQQGHLSKFSDCDFGSLQFVRQGEEAYQIKAPSLTFREQIEIASKMPAAVPFASIPAADINSYVELYRYFPRFTEAEL